MAAAGETRNRWATTGCSHDDATCQPSRQGQTRQVYGASYREYQGVCRTRNSLSSRLHPSVGLADVDFIFGLACSKLAIGTLALSVADGQSHSSLWPSGASLAHIICLAILFWAVRSRLKTYVALSGGHRIRRRACPLCIQEFSDG